MKEEYFTPANLATVAQALLLEARAPHRTKPVFRADDSALLILDMQEYFLQEESHAFVPSARAILPGLQALANAWARRGLPVIYTRHLNTAENAAGMAGWWRDLLEEENPLSAITPHFDVSSSEVIHKSQYDAFYETPLEARLRALGQSSSGHLRGDDPPVLRDNRPLGIHPRLRGVLSCGWNSHL